MKRPPFPPKPSALRSPSGGDCCARCLLEGRIEWYGFAWYEAAFWHRVLRRHWPIAAESFTDDELIYDRVEAELRAKAEARRERWRRLVDKVLP